MISENEAFQLIKNSSKYNHAIMASQIMEELARMLGENAEEWKIVGLLHDLGHDETRVALIARPMETSPAASHSSFLRRPIVVM
jgi:putative nucleotidyltransferase with HDIG domain